MAALYLLQNGAMPTTAALVKVTTGTAIKTMLQGKLLSGVRGKLVEWGISFDAFAAATPIQVECLETGSVFATVTAFSSSDNTDIVKLSDPSEPNPTTGIFSVGTAASGFTATAEGSITATRMFDAQQIPPTGQYVKQWPLGREPKLIDGNSFRVRVTAGAAVNAWCYMVVEV